MKIIVTGATGFVGTEVLRVLRETGKEAIPLVRRPAGLEGEIVVGPLQDGNIDPAALVGAEAVLHLAARTHQLGHSDAGSLAAYRDVNVAGTCALVDATIAAGVRRFVLMSSIKAVAERSTPGQPVGPEAAPKPEDAYGMTKLQAEQEVRQRCESAGLEWTILRPPLVYGPGVQANFDRLIALVRTGFPLPFGAIDNRRSIVDVANLADAAVRACTAPGAANRVLMIADATLSTPELLRSIAAAAGVRLRLLPVPPGALSLVGALVGRRAEIERLCGSLEVDVSATADALGWQPVRSLQDAMLATVQARAA